MQRTISKYVLIEQLGSTPLATTYRAQDPTRDVEVVLKVLRPYVVSNQHLMSRFRDEMAKISNIDHPNILKVHSYEEQGDLQWLVTEYASGPTLRQWLQAPIPPSQVMFVLNQISNALDFAAASGVHHGDIKPGNIFVNPETGTIVLSDFGMAMLGIEAPTGIRAAINTPLPSYSAPELGLGSAPNLSSDTYSLGVLAYDMLTGTVPFNGTERASVQSRQLTSAPTNPSSVNPNIPTQLDPILLKALSRYPERRYQNPSDFVNDFGSASPVGSVSNVRWEPLVDPETQSGFMDLNSEKVEQVQIVDEDSPSVICTICGTTNVGDGTWCVNCWGVLDEVAAQPGQKVVLLEERERIRRRNARRRRTVIGVIASVVITFMFVQFKDITFPIQAPTSDLTAVSEPGEWAMVHRNLEGSGPVPGEDAAGIQGNVKWTFETRAPLSSTPAVKGDRVYLASGDKRVVALDKNSGELIWEHITQVPVDSSPAVAGDMLFYGARNKRFIALDIETGHVRWEFATENSPNLGSPIVSNGIVYIGSADSHIYGIDAVTGLQQWRFPTKDWISNTPALSGNLLVVSSMDGRVTMYNTDTGKRTFSFRGLNRWITGSPVIKGDSIYAHYSHGMLISVNLMEEEVLFASRWYRFRLQLWLWGMADHPGLPKGVNWVTRLGGVVDNTPAVDDEKVYASTGEALLHAVDRFSGKRLWTFICGGGCGSFSPPTIVGDIVLVTDSHGRLHAINKDSGDEEWSKDVANALTSTPVIAGDTLYLASKEGTLYAIE